MSVYGCTSHYGFDAQGYEQRVWACAQAECPGCGAEVVLEADTEAWEEREDGRWAHSEYGPAQGVCAACHILLVDSWEGCTAYNLDPRKGKG